GCFADHRFPDHRQEPSFVSNRCYCCCCRMSVVLTPRSLSPQTPRSSSSSQRFCSPEPTRQASSPPPRLLPVFNLEAALLSACGERVRRALRQEPEAIGQHIWHEVGGFALPLVKALRGKVSLSVVTALLEAGARADEPPGSAETAPLAALAEGTPRKKEFPITALTGGVEDVGHGRILEDIGQGRLSELQTAAMAWQPWFPNQTAALAWQPWSPTQFSLLEEPPVDEEIRIEVARCLLKAGADPQRRSSNATETQTAADLAEAAGRHRLARLLRRADGLRCCQVLEAMWGKRASNQKDHNCLLDLPVALQGGLLTFLGERHRAGH
ncbi:unnamed protein product, partial [Polarella glacialis]